MLKYAFTICFFFFLSPGICADERVYIDQEGIIRWTDTKEEVALFGANYCLPSACDFRAANQMSDDLKEDITIDMAHFNRMGWDGLRVCFWGDFENTDAQGNLVENEHLDLMDYLIYTAGKRGISMLLSPIVTYSSQWPDAMDEPAFGFSTHYKKSELGTNPNAIKAQVNYLQQLLNHTNPYTGVKIKNDPNILFIEMINEPTHHANDVEGSIKYINALTDAVRSTGCEKIVFHNLSQDFNMAKPISLSKVQGVSFGWYPSGLNSGETLKGNYLPTVDHYEPMKNKLVENMPRIVYEFDQPDLLSPAMYPAMVRTFRSVGTQFAAMFSYDMLSSAKANLGWNTHFLNMVYTPQKAIGGIIASEAMKTLPRYKEYGKYPENTQFGNITLDETGYSQYADDEKFIYSASTETMPANLNTLRHIVGYGQSGVVDYEGKGIYFLDKVANGCWRLEVYPDAILVNDPYEQVSPDKTVSRIAYRAWEMQINLPDLGTDFQIEDQKNESAPINETQDGKFTIEPGIYTLTKNGLKVTIPEQIENVGFHEYYAPPATKEPVHLFHQAPATISQGITKISTTVMANTEPDSVEIYLRNIGSGRFRKYPMKKDGYEYSLEYEAENAGFYEYCFTVYEGSKKTTFPGEGNKSPYDWGFQAKEFWKLHVLGENEPVTIFNALEDVSHMNFSRIGDGYRRGVFRFITTEASADGAVQMALPTAISKSLKDYNAAVNITDKIKDIQSKEARSIEVLARGLHENDEFYITLVEADGACWTKKITLSTEWKSYIIGLDEFTPGKAVMLPQGYPGSWNYWYSKPTNRQNGSDHLQLENAQQLQFSLRSGEDPSKEESTIQVSRVEINF